MQSPPETPSDLTFGAFSDDPPWVLDLDELTWLAGIDAIRAACRAEAISVRPRASLARARQRR